MNQPGHRRVAVFSQRVFHHAGKGVYFAGGRNDLSADGVMRVIRIDQGYIVGGHIHAEKAVGAERLAFAFSEGEDFIEILNCV